MWRKAGKALKKSWKNGKTKKKCRKAGKNTWAETGKCHFEVTENRKDGKSAESGNPKIPAETGKSRKMWRKTGKSSFFLRKAGKGPPITHPPEITPCMLSNELRRPFPSTTQPELNSVNPVSFNKYFM